MNAPAGTFKVAFPAIVADGIVPLADRLDGDVPARLRKVFGDLRDEVVAFAADMAGALAPRQHAGVLVRYCEAQIARIAEFQQAETMFHARYSSAVDEAERRAAILEFARQLGADKRQLRRDARALGGFFDADATLERFTRRVGERERALAYALERLGRVAGAALADNQAEAEGEFFIELFGGLIARGRDWRGDARVRRAAHLATARVVRRLAFRPKAYWFDVVTGATRRVCLDGREDAWIQCAAFDSLMLLSPESVALVIRRRLAEGDGAEGDGKAVRRTGDGEVFVRRHLARLLCRRVGSDERLADVFDLLARDPDGAVRQAMAEALPRLPHERAQQLLVRLRKDADPQVRAMLLASPAAMLARLGADDWADHLHRVLTREEDEFTLRLALEGAAETAMLLAGKIEAAHPDEADRPDLASVPAMARIAEGLAAARARTRSARLLRWIDEVQERIWLAGDAEGRAIAQVIAAATATLAEGRSRRMRRLRPYLQANREKVGRVMAVLAQRDFGLALRLQGTPRIQRGEWLKRRLWRILFEGRHSATDKRQAFLHTTGRDFYGPMIAPSARMAELAPTKVPGEPQFVSAEGGWRNYLPLVDTVLSAVDRGGLTEIFTSAGVTEITAPAGIVERTRLFLRISNDFPRLAALRDREPDEFVRQLRAMGIGVALRPYAGVAAANPEVARFYSAGGAFALLPFLVERAGAYFSTVYENSLPELAVFLGLASLWFFGRHVALGWHARRLRNGLALVLGGWGTRGKSGTERLKAGLVNAVGASICSKTTGCEAMFLMGTPFGGLTEMFLFRPYDKATIWEQYNLLKTARGLDSRVFLWECMGLNPSYVRVLQQDWMRDDIGTITNTYPDHEDVQGPAGRNIPEVMCQFIPHGSSLLTTEEEMLPILQQGAARARTSLQSVGWKEAGLIHKSLLARFPYEEHPFNIALVTAMGAQMGLEADFCVKEMADRVVADLGVLKTYPRSVINGRTLEFVMGMSANERFGAMGNWTRMGFIDHALARDPEIFVTTVVNNRADRVPRSRVFARMLVNDVSADKHFLIGSNIDGLIGFIEEELATWLEGQTMDGHEQAPAEVLEGLARQLRIPVNAGELEGRLRAMLAGVAATVSADEAVAAAHQGNLAAWLEKAGVAQAAGIAQHHADLAAQHQAYAALAAEVGKAGPGGGSAHDAAMRTLLANAFRAKLVPVRDYYMKGEMIVRLVADHTPPGLINRIMGMQNIKGTGLDWVYRWQAWEAVAKACQQVGDEDTAQADKAFRFLASYHEFGALSEAAVRAVVRQLRSGEGALQVSALQVDALEERLNAQLRQFDHGEAAAETAEAEETAQDGAGAGWLAQAGGKLLKLAEAFLDPGDAVRRRRAAERIYQALMAEQISTQRAATELKELTARQKGGWLGKGIKERKRRLLAPVQALTRKAA